MIKLLVLFILSLYKKAVSPLLETYLGYGCRFKPTCSEYAREAIEARGLLQGLILSVKRIIRCNPLSRGFYDPVPET